MSPRAILVLALLAPSVTLAQDLGRLFFTPEQREALDSRRKARVPDKPAAAMVVSPTTRVDGFVKRSGGPSTVWVNGAYLHQVPTIGPRAMVNIDYNALLMAGPAPQDLKASGQSVRKVELQTHDGFFTVQGPSKKMD